MVKVHIEEEKEETSPYSSPASSRTSSSVSLSSVSDVPDDESILDRIVALKDIIPPTARHNISTKVSKTVSAIWGTTRFFGNVAWVISTSAIMVGIPLVLAIEGEHMIVQQEKEAQAQQEGQQLLGSPLLPDTKQQQQPVPPGF